MKPIHIVITLIIVALIVGYYLGSLRVKMVPQMLRQPISSMLVVPPVKGFYNGQEILFIHTETSDKKVAEMLSAMMNSPVIFVSALAQTPPAVLDDVFVFTNGVKGGGPMGFQPDVFSSVPSDPDYTPLRRVKLVSWEQESMAREIRSVEEIKKLKDNSEIKITGTSIVVNMPIVSWPSGKR